MTSWRLESGRLVRADTVSVADRAFRYGMSLFETIALQGGRLLFAGEHLARLEKNAGAEGFPWPDELSKALDDLIRRERLPDGVVRVYLSAGEGALLSPPAGSAFVLHEAMDFPDSETLKKGYGIACSPVPYLTRPGGLKSGNYWPNVRALGWAKGKGGDEAALFDPAGNLVSASMANIFVVIDGEIFTPSCARGARDGVVRAWVMNHLAVRTSDITRDMISTSDECFITNSRLGVMPVAGIDGRSLPSRSRADMLARQYRENVR